MRRRETFVACMTAMTLVGCLTVAAEAAPSGSRTTTVWSSALGDRRAGVPTSSVTITSSKLLLVPPATTPPVNVPYGIGKKLYLNRAVYDLTPQWHALFLGDSQDEFAAVKMAWGTIVWEIEGRACGGPCVVVGRFRPGERASTIADGGLEATTSGGALAVQTCEDLGPCAVRVISSLGRTIGPGLTGADPGTSFFAQGAGGRFVIQKFAAGNPSYVLYPGWPALRLPHGDTYGAGQGPGWVATVTGRQPGAFCYRTAALDSPTVLRALICSQSLPLVSNDGTKAVVVQAGHVRLYDTRTGAQINASASPTIANAYAPFVWEAPDRYLVNAQDGTTLVIMRCFTNGLCRRAVTAHTATGVTHIAL